MEDCLYCGKQRVKVRHVCPEKVCSKCGKTGHFAWEGHAFIVEYIYRLPSVHEDRIVVLNEPNLRYGTNPIKRSHIRKCDTCGRANHAWKPCPLWSCSLCKTSGHHYDKICPHVKCEHCGERGHYISTCPSLEKVQCSVCKKHGHIEDYCPTQATCQFCDEYGHSARTCAALHNFCRLCEESGHTLQTCKHLKEII
jgi:hypothetical protein